MAEENGISIGEKRGEKRGERKKAELIAEKMIKMNFPIDLIQKVTGLDEKEIECINPKK